jgi:small subunit ribosomal protein S1
MTGAGSVNALQEAFRNSIPVEGKVKAQIKGGYQVDVMQRRAFCPISQMDLRFQENPEEHVGKTYQFLITQFEEKGKNIVISRRDLLKREHEEALKKFLQGLRVGDQVPGQVTRLMPYGAFVELFPGLEGMVHLSEISWSRVEKAADVLAPQSAVTVKVLGIEPGEKQGSLKISLSIKQVTGDPWESVGESFRIGQKIKGKVTRCTQFGAFVEISPGVDGLVHLSEMSYRKRVNRPEEVVKVGEQVPVVIKEIDLEKRRISLSIKDAEGDPWIDVQERYREGQRIEGVVERKERFGYFVALEPGVRGLLPASRIRASSKPSQLEKLREGDRVNVIIEEIRLEERKISLAPGDSRDEEDWRSFAKREQEHSSIFGEKLHKALEGARKQKG